MTALFLPSGVLFKRTQIKYPFKIDIYCSYLFVCFGISIASYSLKPAFMGRWRTREVDMSRWRETLCGGRIKNVEPDHQYPFSSSPSEVLSCDGKFYAHPAKHAFGDPFSVTLTLPTGEADFLNWQSVEQKTRYSFREQDYHDEIEIPEAAMAYFENKYMK